MTDRAPRAHGVRGRWRAVLVLVGLAALLAGCRAEVMTHVVVTDVDAASVHLEVLFSGDAAVAVSDSGQLDALVATFQQRTGVEPQVVRTDGRVGVAAQLGYQQLMQVAEITGVGGLSLHPGAEGVTTLQLQLVDPTDLRGAVGDAAGPRVGEAGAEAVQAATRLVVTVEFGGGVVDASVPPGADAELDETTLVIDQPLDRFVAGEVAVTGRPGGGTHPLALGAVVVAGLALAVWWVRRDRDPADAARAAGGARS